MSPDESEWPVVVVGLDAFPVDTPPEVLFHPVVNLYT